MVVFFVFFKEWKIFWNWILKKIEKEEDILKCWDEFFEDFKEE